jgi:hypothetical protein
LNITLPAGAVIFESFGERRSFRIVEELEQRDFRQHLCGEVVAVRSPKWAPALCPTSCVQNQNPIPLLFV